jgi:acetyltransferase-like isoleucine patch superfamily enzyme
MPSTEKDATAIAIAATLNHVPWCDDYEKMISGMLFNSLVPELSGARFRARAWCHKYNSWFPHQEASATFDTLATHRQAQFHDILGAVGQDCFIEPPFNVDLGCNIRLGDRVYANINLYVLDSAIVTIGTRTMIGPNVSIFAGTHETDVRSRRQHVEYAAPITIGDDCWIGGHVTILPGVTVGQGSTVGACSVVTRDIPSWSVAVGSPARVIRKVERVVDDGVGRTEPALFGR